MSSIEWVEKPKPVSRFRFIIDTGCKKEFLRLERGIRELGGNVVSTGRYVSEATHCVLGADHDDLSTTPLRLKVLGCLCAGKPVLTANYLEASLKARKFSRKYENFLPRCTEIALEFLRQRGGRFFCNTTFMVLLQERKKKREIEKILEDGGASVKQCENSKALLQLPMNELAEVTHVLTEPSFLELIEFKMFLDNYRDKIGVYSYFWLIKFVMDPREESRKNWEYFQIENKGLTKCLHKPKKQQQQNEGASSSFKMKYKNLRTEKSKLKRPNPEPGVLDHKKPRLANSVFIPGSSKTIKRTLQPEVIEISDDDDDDIEIVKEINVSPKAKPLVDKKPIIRKVPAIRTLEPIMMQNRSPPEIIDMTLDEEKDDEEVKVINMPGGMKYTQQMLKVVTLHDADSDGEDESDANSVESDTDYEPSFQTYHGTDDKQSVPITKQEKMEASSIPSKDSLKLSVQSSEPSKPTAQSAMLPNSETSAQLSIPHTTSLQLPTTIETSVQLPIPVASVELSTPEVSAKLPTSDTSAQLPIPVASVELSTPEVSVQLPTPESSVQLPTAESFVQLPIAESPVQLPTAESTVKWEMTPRTSPDSSMEIESQQQTQSEEQVVEKESQPLDLTNLKKVIFTLLERQKETNECIDIANLKCRTIKFDSKRDQEKEKKRKRRSSKSLEVAKPIDKMTTYALFGITDHDRLTGNASLLDLLTSLDNICTLISSISYPTEEMMHKIFKEYLLETEEQLLAEKSHELFMKLIFLHGPYSPTFRNYYLKIFRINFHQDLQQVDTEFFDLFLSLVQKIVESNDYSSVLALDVILTVMQRDIEYWWKHLSGKSDHDTKQETIIFAFFRKETNIEPFTRSIFKEFQKIRGGNNREKYKKFYHLLYRFFSMSGLLCSFLDGEKSLGSLERRDNLKYKFSSVFQFQESPSDSSRTEIGLLRPSWLCLLVNKSVSKGTDEICDLKNYLDQKKTNSNCDKFLGTFYLNLFYSILKGGCRNKNQFYRMKKLLNPRKELTEGQQNVVVFDSKIAIKLEKIEENLRYLDSFVKNDLQIETNLLISMLRKFHI